MYFGAKYIVATLALGSIAGATPPLPEGARLRDLGEARGVLIGAALKDNLTPAAMGASAYAAFSLVAAREFNFFTPENQHKFRFVHPTAADFTFTVADGYDQFTRDSGGWLHGHTMVWYKASNLPDFVLNTTTRDGLIAVMDTHIEALGSRWGERMRAWDVVNEAITDGLATSPVTWEQGLRGPDVDLWRRVIGDDYVELAFRKAAAVRTQNGRAYELLYNDYNTETLTPKSQAQYLLLQRLVSRGVPIDGVGLQMHLSTRQPDAVDFRSNLKRLSDLGLSLYLTELDSQTGIDAAGEARQANLYHRLFDVALRNPHLRAIQTWGVTAPYSWLPASDGPLLFEAPPASGNDFTAKPAYYALQDALACERRDAVVVNGGFEAGAQAWVRFENPAMTFEVMESGAHSGGRALRIGNRERDYEGPGQDVLARITADGAGAGRYELAGWFRVPSGPARVRLTLRVNDARGLRRYYHVEGVAGASWMRIAGWINVTWFKDLTEATLYAETPGGTVEFALDDVSLGDGSLIANGTMEAGAAGWSPLGPCQVATDSTEPGRHYGTRGLRITGRTSSWHGPSQNIREPLLAAGPGTYSLIGYVKSDIAGNEAKLTVRITSGGQTTHHIVRRFVGNETWTRVSGEVVLDWKEPLSAAIVYVETAAGVEPFAVDDLILRKTAGPATTPFASWQALHFSEAERLAGGIAEAGTDADSDSLPNLVEYALGLDPRRSPGPSTSVPAMTLGADGRLEFEVRHLVGTPVTIEAQLSTDLAVWTPATLERETRAESGDVYEQVYFRETVLPPGTPRRFYRLSFRLVVP
jgi:endo-1,4-beta-xylanase